MKVSNLFSWHHRRETTPSAIFDGNTFWFSMVQMKNRSASLASERVLSTSTISPSEREGIDEDLFSSDFSRFESHLFSSNIRRRKFASLWKWWRIELCFPRDLKTVRLGGMVLCSSSSSKDDKVEAELDIGMVLLVVIMVGLICICLFQHRAPLRIRTAAIALCFCYQGEQTLQREW